MKKRKKIVIGIVMLLIVVGALGFNIFLKKPKDENHVDTVAIKKMDISSSLILKGELESYNKESMYSDLEYKVNKIYVKVGDTVKKGDLLATIDVSNLNKEIESAKLDIEIQENQYREREEDINIVSLQKNIEIREIELKNASKKYQDSKVLYESGDISKDELDTDYNAYIKLQKELDISKEDLNNTIEKNKIKPSELKSIELKKLTLEQKLNDLNNSKIISDIDGVVTEINAKVGFEAMKTEKGLFIIEDINSLEAKFDVNEFDVSKVNLNKAVELTTESIPDKVFKATISNINPTAVKKEGSSNNQIIVPVSAKLSSDIKGLRPGLLVKGKIITDYKKDALVVPYETLYDKGDGNNSVFVVENGALKEVKVKLGVQSDMEVQIISKDLKNNQKVVLNPNETMRTGMKVSI